MRGIDCDVTLGLTSDPSPPLTQYAPLAPHKQYLCGVQLAVEVEYSKVSFATQKIHRYLESCFNIITNTVLVYISKPQ